MAAAPADIRTDVPNARASGSLSRCSALFQISASSIQGKCFQSTWTQRTLVNADEILIVAAPDLANLRNAKNLFDYLRASRVNDRRPFYCLNQVGVPKRPEIKPADFAKALEDQPIAVIPFDPQTFGTAANNGQMIGEMSANHRSAEIFRTLAQILTGRSEVKKAKGGLLSPMLGKLMKRPK